MQNLKCILAILAVCSTIVENVGGFTLYIVLAYILISGIDLLMFNRLKNHSEETNIVFLWGILFMYISTITIFSIGVPAEETATELRWLKALLLFVLILKDTLSVPKLQEAILISYVATAVICAFLMLKGYGVDYDEREIEEYRLTFLGTNANKMAMVYVYSFAIFLCEIDKYIGAKKRGTLLKISFCTILIGLCLYTLAIMGSRGALLCVIIMLLYYFLGTKWSSSVLMNILRFLLGLIIIVYSYNLIDNVDILSERIAQMQEGDYGDRDILVRAAWNIFTNNPVFGIGLSRVPMEIYQATGLMLTPHNLYMYILASGGLIGFSIFFILLVKYIRYIYRYGHQMKRVLSVFLAIGILIDFAKNGGALTTSINYIFFALSMANCIKGDQIV